MHAGIDEVPGLLDSFTLAKLLRPQWDAMNTQLLRSGVSVMLEGDDKDPADDKDPKDSVDDKDPADDKDPKDSVDDKDPADGDGDDTEFVRIPKAEYDAQKKAARQQSERAKKAEREAKAQREREAAEQGRFQELAEGYRGERDEAVREATEAKKDLTNYQRRIEVEKIAKRVGFIDTEDAWMHIQAATLADAAWEDKGQLEKGLKKILRDKPHLQGKGQPTGASRRGGNGTTLTREEIGRMSESEINTRWAEIEEVMASSS